jgi:hypothetical protein
LYINQSINLLINPFYSNVNFSHFYQLIVVLVTAPLSAMAATALRMAPLSAMAVMAWGWQ